MRQYRPEKVRDRENRVASDLPIIIILINRFFVLRRHLLENHRERKLPDLSIRDSVSEDDSMDSLSSPTTENLGKNWNIQKSLI